MDEQADDTKKPPCGGCAKRAAFWKGVTPSMVDEGGTVALWRGLAMIGFGLALVAFLILMVRKGGQQA